jgi:hypothetical protein
VRAGEAVWRVWLELTCDVLGAGRGGVEKGSRRLTAEPPAQAKRGGAALLGRQARAWHRRALQEAHQRPSKPRRHRALLLLYKPLAVPSRQS